MASDEREQNVIIQADLVSSPVILHRLATLAWSLSFFSENGERRSFLTRQASKDKVAPRPPRRIDQAELLD